MKAVSTLTTSIVFLLAISFLWSCEKTIISEEESHEDTAQKDKEANIESSIDTTSIKFMSVREVQSNGNGEPVWLVAYIVASCQRSMKNCDFTAPFEGSSAIVLSDTPIGTNTDIEYTDAGLLPVCLTTHTAIRNKLNLVNNPQLWNKRIYLVGMKGKYMSRDGIKNVFDYIIAD